MANHTPHKAVWTLIRWLPSVAATVLLKMGRVAEFATTVIASEARLVGVNQHVVIEWVLPCEDGLTYPALIWTDACNQDVETQCVVQRMNVKDI